MSVPLSLLAPPDPPKNYRYTARWYVLAPQAATILYAGSWEAVLAYVAREVGAFQLEHPADIPMFVTDAARISAIAELTPRQDSFYHHLVVGDLRPATPTELLLTE